MDLWTTWRTARFYNRYKTPHQPQLLISSPLSQFVSPVNELVFLYAQQISCSITTAYSSTQTFWTEKCDVTVFGYWSLKVCICITVADVVSETSTLNCARLPSASFLLRLNDCSFHRMNRLTLSFFLMDYKSKLFPPKASQIVLPENSNDAIKIYFNASKTSLETFPRQCVL